MIRWGLVILPAPFATLSAPLAALLVALAVLLWPQGGRRARASGTPAPPAAPMGPPVAACPAMPVPTQVAVAAELLALALQSGTGVATALEAVAGDGDDAAGRALRTLAAGRRWGLRADTLEELVSPEWRPIAAALRLADESGVPPAQSLGRVAADQRARSRHAVEVATARLRVRLVLPLGACLLPAFVLITVVPVVLALAARLAAP